MGAACELDVTSSRMAMVFNRNIVDNKILVPQSFGFAFATHCGPTIGGVRVRVGKRYLPVASPRFKDACLSNDSVHCASFRLTSSDKVDMTNFLCPSFLTGEPITKPSNARTKIEGVKPRGIAFSKKDAISEMSAMSRRNSERTYGTA
jgi:hypothetical protein